MATQHPRPWRALRPVVAAAGIGVVLTAAGCSGSTTPSSSSGGDISGDLNIIVSSADASDAAFQEVVDAFNAKYPDAKATLTSVPNDTYPATKSAQITAGNADIFVVKNFREVPDYASDSTSDDVQLAQAGGLVDLTDQDFMSNYTESVLKTQEIDGKQYAVPTGLSYATGVYYNKTLFAQAGITEAPTTWTELQADVTALKAAGLTPFGIGGKDGWPAGMPMQGIVASLYPTDDDKQALVDGLWDQSDSLDSGLPLEVLEKTQYVYENAQANFAGAGYDDIPALFASGGAAMVADGTWNQPTIAAAVGSNFEIGFFPFPGSDDAADNANLNGKIELQLAVSAASTHQEAALAFLDLFSQKDTYSKFVATAGYSSAQPDIEQSDFLNSISQYTGTFQSLWETLWIANNDAGQEAVYPFNYAALAPLGSSTAADAAKAAQTAWSAAF